MFCKFQPAFNTSDTVAALLPAFFTISAASSAVIGALVTFSGAASTTVPSGMVTVLSSSFTDGRLDLTLPNVVGAPISLGAAAGLTILVVKSAGATSVVVGLPLSSTVKYLSPTLVTGVPFLSVY